MKEEEHIEVDLNKVSAKQAAQGGKEIMEIEGAACGTCVEEHAVMMCND